MGRIGFQITVVAGCIDRGLENPQEQLLRAMKGERLLPVMSG